MSAGHRAAEASALATASLAIQMTCEDPELMKRLQGIARDAQVPWSPERLDEHGLTLMYRILMMMAMRAAEGKGQAGAEDGQVLHVPLIRGMESQSAGALGLASFAIEYLHAVPGVRESFVSWLETKRPGSGIVKLLTTERLEAADSLVTLMAEVAAKISDQQEPEPDGDDEPVIV